MNMKSGIMILINGCDAEGYVANAGFIKEIKITNEENRYEDQEYEITARDVRTKKLTLVEGRKIIDIVRPCRQTVKCSLCEIGMRLISHIDSVCTYCCSNCGAIKTEADEEKKDIEDIVD